MTCAAPPTLPAMSSLIVDLSILAAAATRGERERDSQFATYFYILAPDADGAILCQSQTCAPMMRAGACSVLYLDRFSL